MSTLLILLFKNILLIFINFGKLNVVSTAKKRLTSSDLLMHILLIQY